MVSIYVAAVLRVYLAQRYAHSSSVEDLGRAIRLAPDSADFPHQLGLQLSAADPDSKAAIASLSRAAILNPNNARYWLDLASAYLASGNSEKQNEAVESALRAEPGNPAVAAEAGEFFLIAGDQDRALPLFRRALAQDPEAANTVLITCWRETGDANTILARVIPDSPELQLEFLGILVREKQTSAAQHAWEYLVSSHKTFRPELSFFYFDYLLHERDVLGFERAWHELAGLAPTMRAYLPEDNLIVNAGFEQPNLNSGFDWRHAPADHIIAGIDDNVAHSGSHSLSLIYDGGPAYDAGWTQFVPVQSNADYEFSAWIKSDNVISSSGPRIAIVDAYSGGNLLLTEDVLDTHPWQEIKGTLRVPANTGLLAVRIVRAPANTRIRGRVWIDDLRLVKK
jgi:tetratricopeptide (TPR) repeat protein